MRENKRKYTYNIYTSRRTLKAFVIENGMCLYVVGFIICACFVYEGALYAGHCLLFALMDAEVNIYSLLQNLLVYIPVYIYTRKHEEKWVDNALHIHTFILKFKFALHAFKNWREWTWVECRLLASLWYTYAQMHDCFLLYFE